MSMHHSMPHDSGHKHVAGTAEYIDDIPMPAGGLHAYLGLGTKAHARIVLHRSRRCPRPRRASSRF